MTNTTETTDSNYPSHIAYQVKDREGETGIWTRIGAVWPHKDGKGFDVRLEAVPLNGRVSLRVRSEIKE